MYKGKSISVVVPAFREQELIAETILGVPDFVDHIIVVDDCSPDETSERAAATAHPKLTLITLKENVGVGGAIIEGHKRALELESEISVVMAGDNQMDPDELPKLLDPIIDEGYEFTKGSRFFSFESMKGMPRHRVFGNIVLTFLNKAASGYWNLVDPQNGYTAISASALAKVPLDKIAKRYEFENDLLIWLNIAGVRARDVNIPARYGMETSTVKLLPFITRTTWLLFTGFWRRIWLKYILWSFSPIALLLIAGLLMMGIGSAFGIWATTQAIKGTSPTAGTTMLSVVPFMIGFMMLIQSFVLDIMETPK